MSFFAHLLHHPRRLFLRRVVFQVHLWLGCLLSLYLVLISLSGALLVYHDTLTRSTLPDEVKPYDPLQTQAIPAVVTAAQKTYPDAEIKYVNPPSASMPVFLLQMQTRNQKPFQIVADPQTGHLYPLPRSWVDVVYDFHTELLLGSAHGMQWNGVGAAALLAVALTGILLWWRGVKTWWRGLGVSLHHHWRRLNFDLHYAIGFWTLSLVCWWALSGMYFAWSKPFTAAVSALSPLQGAQEPSPQMPLPPGRKPFTLQDALDTAGRASPRGHLSSFINPGLTPGDDVYAYMNLRSPEDYWHADIVHLDVKTGSIISVWHYGENHSAGDWFLWAMQPLHFGIIWGPWVRALWFLFGVSLAVLTVTGLLMYWNRYLRFRWQGLSPRTPSLSRWSREAGVRRSRNRLIRLQADHD